MKVKTTTPLSGHQQKVIDAFQRKDVDVAISAIFMRVYGAEAWDEMGTTREMQQKLSPTFAEINNKLTPPCRIEPGLLKQTYRYATTKKES